VILNEENHLLAMKIVLTVRQFVYFGREIIKNIDGKAVGPFLIHC